MEYKIKNLQSIDSLEIARELSEMNVTEQFTFDADFNWALFHLECYMLQQQLNNFVKHIRNSLLI